MLAVYRENRKTECTHKYPEKRLLVHWWSEAVSQDHVSAGRVSEASHFEQTNLVKTASKDVDAVSVMAHTFAEMFPILYGLVRNSFFIHVYILWDSFCNTWCCLCCRQELADVRHRNVGHVLDIVVTPYGFLQFWSYHHSRTLSCRPACE